MANTTNPNSTDEIPPEMDYAMHERTYEGFIAMVKWGIISMVYVVLALYCFIEADQPLLGLVLLLLIPVTIGGAYVMRERK
ncbi:aa3-type cytochrome c oxidase subunit IV [Devosia sp.]|uniref:aa3-type cytochrome c oxidase subunit IV n=1 Tax=Devosia sp. TaxID=1871048 RepID=UPI003A947CD5